MSTSQPEKGIPSNPILFREGTALPPKPELGINYPQNLWLSITQMQDWFGKNVLGINTKDAYKEPSYIAEAIDPVEEADKKRTGDKLYTDRRGLKSFGLILGVDGTDSDERLQNEFKGKSVVDIGSGAGVLSNDLRQENIAADVTEVDFSAQVLEGLPPIFQDRGRRLVSDGTDLAIEDAATDRTVNMFSTTVYTDTVESRLRGLAETIRITKVGGRAFVIPLLGGIALRQRRGYLINQYKHDPAFYDDDMKEYEASIRQVAAMDYALIGFVNRLLVEQTVSLTPIIKFQQKKLGIYDCISGIFDVNKPLPKSKATELMDPCVAQFTAD